jgi:ABC-type Zn uptake system ZnuABC Zn-binding protein ZnuA
MKSSKVIEKQLAQLNKRLAEALAAEVKEETPKIPHVNASVWKNSSESRYKLFNKIIDAIRKRDRLKNRQPIAVYRDGRPGGISVKVGWSENQKRVSEDIRKQLRRLADKVTYSTYYGIMDDKPNKVERYLFNVQPKRRSK